MEKYVAAGTPIGPLTADKKQYVMVNGMLLGIDPVSYRIWISFLSGRTREQVLNREEIRKIADREKADACISELHSLGLLVSLAQIMQYVPQRQGMGQGYSKNTGDCIIHWNHPAHVPWDAYLLWCYCDGVHSFAEIAEILKRQNVGIAEEHLMQMAEILFRECVILLVAER